MTLIDTAEMYGGGRSERLVGEAIKGTERGRLFIVSKVLPNNAGRRGIFRSCEESLQRLGTDYLDLYLLHWRGSVPLAETVECMEKLERDGLIRGWGVSNFDTDDMEELRRVKGGDGCLVNQVLYHAASRGIEYSLLPQMRERGVALMAYCPLAQGGSLRRGLFRSRALNDIAARRGATVAQITGTSPETLEQLYALAHNLYGSQSFADAETLFRALCLYNPHEPKYWMGLGGSRQAQGRFEGASDAYQMAALTTGLSDPEPLFFAARCLLKMNKKAEAVEGLEGLLGIGDDANPRHADVHRRAESLLALLKGGKTV